jgi:hypothetical protein
MNDHINGHAYWSIFLYCPLSPDVFVRKDYERINMLYEIISLFKENN